MDGVQFDDRRIPAVPLKDQPRDGSTEAHWALVVVETIHMQRNGPPDMVLGQG